MRILLLLGFLCYSSLAVGQGYVRATDDPENVKDKIYPKKRKVELNLPDVGLILNQAFITTYLIHGGLTYFPSEEWGYGIEASFGLNQDKSERDCLENFYNDPLDDVSEECGDGGELDNTNSNYGPAYMPIREINYIIAGNVVWNPVYGKQLFFMSLTSYFDVFVTLGGGVVLSDYYEQRNELNNGNKARADFQTADRNGDGQADGLDGGASTDETDSYGEAGRPVSQSQTHPFINIGLGQKYHFAKRFHIKFEARNMTLLGTPGGFENLFAIWFGTGMRL